LHGSCFAERYCGVEIGVCFQSVATLVLGVMLLEQCYWKCVLDWTL